MAKQKVYIAGAITKDKTNYKERFAKAEIMLRNAGYEVLNPALVEEDERKTYKDYIDETHELLKQADCLYALETWIYSDGAWLEIMYARTVGLKLLNIKL